MAIEYRDYGATKETLPLTPDTLYAGEAYRTEMPCTIANAAGALTRGQVLGRISATGLYTAYSNGAGDGSETAVGILGVDVPAPTGAGDTPAFMYVTGEFNQALLIGLDTAARADLAALNIYAKKVD